MAGSTGPSIRAVVRCINKNSCGSGSICGVAPDGESYVMTNAHVGGTTIGRVLDVYVERLQKNIKAEVVRAAYSSSVIADWCLLKTMNFGHPIEPVYLSKTAPPSEMSLYTKGFPKCQPHNGTDITQHALLNNGVGLWLPDAIPGQSGSGVWSDDDNFMYYLLTWSWTQGGRTYGAGQSTAEIYRQNRDFEIRGFAMMPGLVPLPAPFPDENQFDWTGIDRTHLSDPVVETGFHSLPREMGIQDYPIWAGDVTPPPPPPPPGDAEAVRKAAIEGFRRVEDFAAQERKKLEGVVTAPIDPNDDEALDDTFGL